MRFAQKFFKNQIQIFQIILNTNGLWHGGASNIIIPRRGINLQDLQDFCRDRGKENKNANCTNVPGLLESFVDALRAEIFQKSDSNFSNYF